LLYHYIISFSLSVFDLIFGNRMYDSSSGSNDQQLFGALRSRLNNGSKGRAVHRKQHGRLRRIYLYISICIWLVVSRVYRMGGKTASTRLGRACPPADVAHVARCARPMGERLRPPVPPSIGRSCGGTDSDRNMASASASE